LLNRFKAKFKFLITSSISVLEHVPTDKRYHIESVEAPKAENGTKATFASSIK